MHGARGAIVRVIQEFGNGVDAIKTETKNLCGTFSRSRKTILENQRVMRLKAASWVNSQQSDDPVSVKFARISDQAHNHALQSLKLYRMYLDAKENPDGLTKDKVEDHKKKMYEHLKKDISF